MIALRCFCILVLADSWQAVKDESKELNKLGTSLAE